MNFFERVLYFFNNFEMNEPTRFGWFHWLWIFLTIGSVFLLYKKRTTHNEKQLNKVLLIYGLVALFLEIFKQIMWAFSYDTTNNLVIWDYEWYAFPFQLCTTPIFVSIICAFLKKGKLKSSLLSYLSFVTILGSIATIIIPDDCFVSDIFINIHTMWLHCGSLVVSLYLLLSGEVELKINNFINAILVFIFFVVIALILNISIYQSGILGGETFNMFYISPYFISSLPIFDIIQESVPYICFLITYISILTTGAFVVYIVSIFIKTFL